MAPAERVARQLTQQIEESNALNRAIQINLISEDEADNSTTDTFKIDATGFFQKRAKLDGTIKSQSTNSVKLKRIGYSDTPPFPKAFQLQKESTAAFEANSVDPRITKKLVPVIKQHQYHTLDRSSEPLSKIIKDSCSEMDSNTLEHLNKIIGNRSLTGVASKKKYQQQVMALVMNEIELNLSTNQPVVWVFTGPPGVGKTSLVESITSKLDSRLLTIDSTNGPRNSKTFETLQTTLTHSAPRSFSQFFATPEANKKQKVAVLFDEVEIAFEGDRGFWSALSTFLNSPVSHAVPIFITSNASQTLLETIIKFPEYAQFIFINEGDHRNVSIDSDFISRLHCIDTSMEYEHFSLVTGYHLKNKNSVEDSNPFHREPLICEALRWGNLLENVNTCDDSSCFEYSEASSLADILLSIPDPSIRCRKMNLDQIDNLQSEFFAFDLGDWTPSFANSLLYSNLPEIYEIEAESTAKNIARELLERTIHPNPNNNSNVTDHSWWSLSKRVSKRFFDYTRSLQSTAIWASELTSHVRLIENENAEEGNVTNNHRRARGRRKKAYYRYLGDELLNELTRESS